MPPKKEEQKATSSKDSGIFAALAYLLGPIVAILLYLLKKDDKLVKFHALQSILFGIALTVLMVAIYIVAFILAIVTSPIGGVGGAVGLCIFPIMGIALLYVLYAAYKALTGEMYKIPLVGDFAMKYE